MDTRFRYRAIIWLVLVLALQGCITKTSITGKQFVPQEVLVEVLVDIHLMDGITNDRKFHRRYEADSIDLLTPILDKHSVTLEMFDVTMDEYGRYPDLLDQVYNEVLIKLNVMLDENDKDENDDDKPSTPKE